MKRIIACLFALTLTTGCGGSIPEPEPPVQTPPSPPPKKVAPKRAAKKKAVKKKATVSRPNAAAAEKKSEPPADASSKAGFFGFSFVLPPTFADADKTPDPNGARSITIKSSAHASSIHLEVNGVSAEYPNVDAHCRTFAQFLRDKHGIKPVVTHIDPDLNRSMCEVAGRVDAMQYDFHAIRFTNEPDSILTILGAWPIENDMVVQPYFLAFVNGIKKP
jgi:hypothetical protein